MPTAKGSSRDFFHVKEVTHGVDPGTPYTKDRFLAAARLRNESDQMKSDEMVGDRSVSQALNGLKRARFSAPFEFKYGAYDDFIESAMCSAWVAPGSAASGQTVTVVAGATNTMAATSIGTGLAVGDWIKVSGFTGGFVANNGYFRVTVQATGTITLGEAKNPDGTSRLVAATSQSGITVRRMGYLLAGSSVKSLAIEQAQPDINEFQRALGVLINRMSLSIQQGAKITGSFEGIGLQLPAPAGVKYRTGTDVAASTESFMQSYNSRSSLWLDGASQAIVTGLDFQLDNGMEDMFGVFQTVAYDVVMGRSNLSGSLVVGKTGSTLHTKAYNNTAAALRALVLNEAGTSGYAFDIPTIKLSLPEEDTQENKIFQTFNWQAEKDSATGIINWEIWKLE